MREHRPIHRVGTARATSPPRWLRISSISRPLASSMMAPALPQIERDFHTSNSHLAVLSISIYVS